LAEKTTTWSSPTIPISNTTLHTPAAAIVVVVEEAVVVEEEAAVWLIIMEEVAVDMTTEATIMEDEVEEVMTPEAGATIVTMEDEDNTTQGATITTPEAEDMTIITMTMTATPMQENGSYRTQRLRATPRATLLLVVTMVAQKIMPTCTKPRRVLPPISWRWILSLKSTMRNCIRLNEWRESSL